MYYSLLLLCKCWGTNLRVEGEDDIYGDFAMELALPAATGADDNALALFEPLDWEDVDEDEEASVDFRAQRFIERFYEEMRMQRRESL